ncbi:MAG: DUF4396 domain-containing protein [Solirubrobacterales bacterium]
MPPLWLTILAWIWIGIGFVSAALIIYDIRGRGYRQRMPIMEVVWPVTALYFGFFAVFAYMRWGRTATPRWIEEKGERDTSFPVKVAVGVSHCGSGCTLGDIIGGWLVFLLTLQILGSTLLAEYAVDYAFAFTLGILFQYLTIKPMKNLSVGGGIREAVKVDTFSLTSFEVGLFGWMALMRLVFFTDPNLEPDQIEYWFLMQIGMMIGFATAYPVNWLLIKRGVKPAM